MSEVSKAEEDVCPKWLDNTFLEKALRSSGDESISVTSYEVSRATAPGDHYATDMFRVKVHFLRGGQSESKAFVIKAEKPDAEVSRVIRESKLFQREGTVLEKVVPKLEEMLQKETSIPVKQLAAKCFFNHFGPPASVIVLEDLKEIGFKMAERTSGLDMDHSLLVLKALARYHAASVVQWKRDPESLDMFSKTAFVETVRKPMESFFVQGLGNIASEMEKWPEFDKSYSEKLRKISHIAIDYIILKCHKCNPENFNVLTHGDLWLNNLMFQYSTSTSAPQEVRFVDFQTVLFGDVALDLIYFLHTSTSLDLLDKQHILLEEYHRTLGETFTALGHAECHPSLEQVKKQIENKGLYAVIMACLLLQFIVAEKSDLPDMDKMLKNENPSRYPKQFREALAILFPQFDKKGWLELNKFL